MNEHTAEFRFILDDEIHAWALLLANVGFTVQARHVKPLRGKDPDGVMKVRGPAAGLVTVKKALELAGAELLAISPKALQTTGVQAIATFSDAADVPDVATLLEVWGLQLVLHPEITDECSASTAYASVRGQSALGEGAFLSWLNGLVHPIGGDCDCAGADDGPTEWEHMIELPKQLQREFPDHHRRFLAGEFRSVTAAAIAAGLIKTYPPYVAN